jgi:hypothetical protein
VPSQLIPLPGWITFDCKTPGLHGFASKIAAINGLGVILRFTKCVKKQRKVYIYIVVSFSNLLGYFSAFLLAI